MGTRRQARECALQMLYQLDMSASSTDEAIAHFWEANPAGEDVRLFANELVKGVASNVEGIDSLLAAHSTNWKLSRMAAVDKNILRMAAFEITRRTDIPPKVTINEAVEIAKKFGTADSGAFVNGILDNIAHGVSKEGGEEEGASV
ncbi:MAG: transcription antitermination factor NusB [Pseudomonadota bacterium]